MAPIHRLPDHFEAMIRIFRPAEGGYTRPPFNGIRWGFAYAENQPAGKLCVICPDFCDEQGGSLPTDRPLPIGIEKPARVVLFLDEMREKLHRSRIRAGVRFYCYEGDKRVAQGRITKVTGLLDAQPK